jgi:predicted nucleotidyltransferase
MSEDFTQIIPRLVGVHVEFILIGGMAATVHGSARLTHDIDIVYSRAPENLRRLVEAIHPLHPYPRGAPPGLPFSFDVETLRAGLNFTLTTDLGDLDILGEVAGGGAYEDLVPESQQIELMGVRCRCVTLEGLIQLKRAAGRPRDLDALAELEALREERDSQ